MTEEVLNSYRIAKFAVEEARKGNPILLDVSNMKITNLTYIRKVIGSYLYNDELFKLQAIDIKKFDELKGIIGTSKAQAKTNDITVNQQGLTNEEYDKALEEYISILELELEDEDNEN